MSSLNKVMIIGRLGRDPEMRYTQAGKPVCSLNVATDEGYTNDRGEKVDKTEWHKVVFWDRQAETCSQYLAKTPGSSRTMRGRMTSAPVGGKTSRCWWISPMNSSLIWAPKWRTPCANATSWKRNCSP